MGRGNLYDHNYSDHGRVLGGTTIGCRCKDFYRIFNRNQCFYFRFRYFGGNRIHFGAQFPGDAKKEKSEELVTISAADPLNLSGTVFNQHKVARLSANRILFEDGIPVAILESKEIKYLKKFSGEKKHKLHQALVKNHNNLPSRGKIL